MTPYQNQNQPVTTYKGVLNGQPPATATTSNNPVNRYSNLLSRYRDRNTATQPPQTQTQPAAQDRPSYLQPPRAQAPGALTQPGIVTRDVWLAPGREYAGLGTGEMPTTSQNVAGILQSQGFQLPKGFLAQNPSWTGYQQVLQTDLERPFYEQPFARPGYYETGRQIYEGLMNKDYRVDEDEINKRMQQFQTTAEPVYNQAMERADEIARMKGLDPSGGLVWNPAAGGGLFGDITSRYTQSIAQEAARLRANARLEELQRQQQMYQNMYGLIYAPTQQQMNMREQIVEGQRAMHMNQQAQKNALAAQQDAANAGMWGGIGSSVGGVVGAGIGLLGGPAAPATVPIGYQMGSQLGSFGAQTGAGF